MFSMETSLDDLARDGYVILDSVFSEAFVKDLLQAGQAFYQNGKFRPGRVGQGSKKTRRQAVRGDEICWITDWSQSPLAEVETLFKDIQRHLRSFLYLPIKRFESHFAFYPPGTHYLKHKDRHRLNPSRILSCVIYLSPWPDQGGGELVLYSPGQTPVVVEPRAGRTVLFVSELEHEVLPTRGERWSLTAWFRDDLVAEIHL